MHFRRHFCRPARLVVIFLRANSFIHRQGPDRWSNVCATRNRLDNLALRADSMKKISLC
ncbi:hypothetical protein MPLB_1510195 [Mesorhizobium sp. ORS 3324]|nr:hypothetical protein MPLB_1510195 [Mesorhizobium sp. ORS 3324]